MSQIIKTEAFILSKMNYGDTSSIVTLFTKDFGRLSAIIKGARSPKSKIGLAADPLNNVEVIFYKKDTREIQILTSASLINHYSHIKEDFEKLKFSYAVLELIKKLTAEHEVHEKLYRGIEKIFHLFENSDEKPSIIFGRFFLFFLSEIGYEIQFEECAVCGNKKLQNMELSYNFELGILCNSCKENYLNSYLLTTELFSYLYCLKQNKRVEKVKDSTIKNALIFMENFLKNHVPDFKGIQSFQIYK